MFDLFKLLPQDDHIYLDILKKNSNCCFWFIHGIKNSITSIFKERISKLFKEHQTFLFGSRIARLGSHIERLNSRWLFGRISASFAAMTLGLGVYDTQCGAKFFRPRLVPILFNKPFLSRWLFDVELFFRMMNHFGKKEAENQMIEIPLDVWIEMGDSKLTMMDILKVPFELLKIRRHYHGNTKN